MKKQNLMYICSATALTFASPAIAQEQSGEGAEAQSRGLAEIVVTAQKRSENLQKVPIAVTAFSSESLEQARFADARDFATQVPSLNISTPFGQSNPYITLRGMGNGGDFNQNIDSGVAVHIDEVYQASQATRLFQLYDLDRVEVLKGPQGTLFGKNATGGSLNYFSKLPDGKTEGYFQATYGRFNQLDIEAGVSLPLSDTLSVRLAGVSHTRDGRDLNTFSGHRINNIDNQGVKLTLLWEPSEQTKIYLNAHYGRSKADAYVGKQRGLIRPDALGNPTFDSSGNPILLSDRDAVDGLGVSLSGYHGYADPNPRHLSSNDQAQEELTTRGGWLRIEQELSDSVNLTAITAYEKTDRIAPTEFDYSGDAYGMNWWVDNSNQISQEIRLDGSSDKFKWIVGVYGFRGKIHAQPQFDWLRVLDSGPMDGVVPLQLFLDVDSRQTTKTAAIFGEASYQFNDQLKLTVGLRYNHDRKNYSQKNDMLFVGGAGMTRPIEGQPCIPCNGQPRIPLIPLTSNSASWDNLSVRTILDYQISDDVMAYASFNRGYKSGGFAVPLFNQGAILNPFKPERLDAYEAGLKTMLLDRRVRLNVNGFYYKVKNLQVFTLDTTLNPIDFVLNNASAAEIYGLEGELVAKPTDQLQLSLNAGYTHSKYLDFKSGTAVGDATGNQLQFTPKFTVSGAIDYEIPTGGDSSVNLHFGGFYNSNTYYNAANTLRGSSDGGFGELDASISWRNGNGLTVTGWVKNLTDTTYIPLTIDLTGFGVDMVAYNNPRTYGLTVRHAF